MTSAEQRASTVPPRDIPHQCSCCGAVYSPAEWAALPNRRDWFIAPGDVVEYAECVGIYRDGDVCRNTLTKPVPR